MWMIPSRSRALPQDAEIQSFDGDSDGDVYGDGTHDQEIGDSAMTLARFDELCERWRVQPFAAATVDPASPEAVQRCIECVRKTLQPYEDAFTPQEELLYQRLMASRRKQDITILLFGSFQMIWRVRGPAIAILRVEELARWVR